MSIMGSSTTSGSRNSGGGGFFSSVATALGETVGGIAKEQLPVWAAKELNLQRADQLAEPTFISRDDVPRIDDARGNTGEAVQSGAGGVFGTNISMMQAVIAGVGVLGLISLGIIVLRR